MHDIPNTHTHAHTHTYMPFVRFAACERSDNRAGGCDVIMFSRREITCHPHPSGSFTFAANEISNLEDIFSWIFITRSFSPLFFLITVIIAIFISRLQLTFKNNCLCVVSQVHFQYIIIDRALAFSPPRRILKVPCLIPYI